MNDAKIRLSQKEMELINNADWILTKNAVLKKVDHFLAALQVLQKDWLTKKKPSIPAELLLSSPKISKGENYNGLPYRMLDFPKVFNQSEIFAVRTMFWWGSFFSVTLHLAGKYKKQLEEKIIADFPVLQKENFFCCINEDQWQHHFEETNYKPISIISETEFDRIIRRNDFCKIAGKVPLQDLQESETMLLSYFKKLIEMLDA